MDNNEEKIKKTSEDVERKVSQVQSNVKEDSSTQKKAMDEKTKKIITFSAIGGGALILLIILIVVFASILGKPSKSAAEKIIKTYVQAMNDDDGEKAMSVIDTEGYIIFKEDGEKKFDKNYKNKKKYLKEYYDDNNFDDKDQAEEDLEDYFESSYKYSSYEYSLKEIVSIEKSSKSKKLYIVKAKIKEKLTSTSNTSTYKFYMMKVGGKYKIVGLVR